MICPKCRADKSKVLESRLTNDGLTVRRRRRCGTCGSRWTTKEHLEGLVAPESQMSDRPQGAQLRTVLR